MSEEDLASTHHRWRLPVGLLALLGGSLSFLVGAAVITPAFAVVGVPGSVALRLGIGSLVLMVVMRPKLRGRTAADWWRIAALGGVIAAMSTCSYAAFARIPLGTATALELVGPLAVAVLAGRKARHFVGSALAAAGVLLICRPSASSDRTGILFGLLTAAALGVYLVLQGRQARLTARQSLEQVTLSLTVAACLTLPIALRATPHITRDTLLPIVISSVLGIAVAYNLDAAGVALLGSRRASLALASDPALATGIGFVLLGQVIQSTALAGILTLLVASAIGKVAVPDSRPLRRVTAEAPATDIDLPEAR
jgi:inner membrane transporter RhtA